MSDQVLKQKYNRYSYHKILRILPYSFDHIKFLITTYNIDDIETLECTLCHVIDNTENLELVKYLVERIETCLGYELANHKSSARFLVRACKKGSKLSVVKYLLDKNIPIHNSILYDALSTAVEERQLEIVKCLVDNGADVNVDDDAPILLAARKKYPEIVRYLMRNGAKIHNDWEEKHIIRYGSGDNLDYPELVDYIKQFEE